MKSQKQYLAHILVVDDDDRLRLLLKKYLSENGYAVSTAEDANAARKLLGFFVFDLMILDVMMPQETGLELLASLTKSRPPILMLSALGESDDRIKGLEGGAEDYLAKPFEPKELLLRIKAILRRTDDQALRNRTICFGRFKFDVETGQLKREDEAIYLTGSESDTLKMLAKNVGKPVSREALSRLLPEGSNERSVDVQITRLRKKIEESEGRPVFLQTIRGAGYVLYLDV